MKKIALTLFALGLFASSNGFAADDNSKVAERKAKITAHLDKKIALLNEFKTCVNGASKKGDIKACRQAHKPKMKALKEERKAMKKNK